MIANLQEHKCKVPWIGIAAKWGGMDGIDEDRDFVRRLLNHTGKAASRLALDAGLTPSTLLRIVGGKATTRISQPTIEKLKTAAPDFPDWARVADLPPVDAARDFLPIPILPSFAGMGGGGTGEGDQEIGLVPRRFVEEDLRAKPSDLILVEARGTSMAPDFQHGDQILIDKRDRNPAQPGAFALFDGDAYLIKFVERIAGRPGWYRVFSADDRFSAYELEEQESTILGRPVWFARRL